MTDKETTMKKQILICAVCILLLAGCGKANDNNGSLSKSDKAALIENVSQTDDSSRNDTKRGEIRIDFDNPQDITDYDGNVSIKAFFESDDRSYDNGEWFGYLLFVESGSSYLANTELPAYEEAMQTVYDELLWIGDKFTTTVPEDSYYGIDEIGDSLR